MPHFQYHAQNEQRQAIAGQIEAESVAQAIALLEARGLAVQSIGYMPAGVSDGEPSGVAADDASPEQAALRSHLVQVLERGGAMAPPLRAFAQELPSGKRRTQLEQAIAVLERGDVTLAAADLARLPEFWVPLLSASAASNDPGRILAQFLEESERASELRRQRWRAVAYPALLLLLACAVLVLMSVVVIPLYRQMFEEFDLALPRVTVFVLNLSAAINSGRLLLGLLVAVIAIYVLYRLGSLLPQSWRTWWSDAWGTPLGRATAAARLATICADLMQTGLPTAAALRIAGHCSQSPRLQRAAWLLARDVERNEGLPSRKQPGPLPHSLILALRGNLPEAAQIHLLREVGECFAQRADARLSWKHGLIEPLAVLVVGLLVGLTLLALFMPLISLIRGLSGG